MKKIIGLYLLVVVTGVITSIFVSEKITDETFKLYSGLAVTETSYSFALDNTMAMLEAYEKDDISEFYEIGCIQVRMSLETLKLYGGNIEGAQKVETELLIDKANVLLSRLEQTDKCK